MLPVLNLTWDTDGNKQRPGPYDRPPPVNPPVKRLRFTSFEQLYAQSDRMIEEMRANEHLWLFACDPAVDEGMLALVTPASPSVELIQYKYLSRKIGLCGTYNCVDLDVPASKAIKNVIKSIQPGTPPPTEVTVRYPIALPKEYEYSEDDNEINLRMVAELHELFMTLYMSMLRLAPPLYAAVPIFNRSPSEEVRQFGYVYVTEAGWTSLHGFLSDDLDSEQTSALAASTLECVRKTSANGMLLLDVKTLNMVVRELTDARSYDVRMIDFGSDFALYTGGIFKGKTLPSCIFFVNGLLLLNDANKMHGGQREVFLPLCVEVVAMWRAMKELDAVSGLCAYLYEDTVYAERLELDPGEKPERPPIDLYLIQDEDDLIEHLSTMFYVLLQRYGVYVDLKARDTNTLPYIDKLIAKLKVSWQFDQNQNDRVDARASALVEDLKQASGGSAAAS